MHMSEECVDQAAGLRHAVTPKPVKVIAVTSGKGGVGKTNLSVNLGTALANNGRAVMLMDADLGLANVDVLLGLQPHFNLSHVLNGERTLGEIIVTTPNGLQVVPAASGTQHMAELEPAECAGVIHAFSEIGHQVDVMLVDTSAGISDSVVRFSQASQQVIVVVCDEPASITDAYALIKVLSREYGIDRFHIVANMVRNEQEGRGLFTKISRVTERFLDVTLEFTGMVPYDESLRKAVQRQKTVVEAFPNSRSAIALKGLADEIDNWPTAMGARGHLEFFVERLIRYRPESTEVLP